MYHDSDILIIGSGFAAFSFLKAYKNTKQKITVLESGDWKFSIKYQEKNKVKTIGYPLRNNFETRARQVGGTSSIWGGRLMALRIHSESESEWNLDSRTYKSYSLEASQGLGVNSEFLYTESANSTDVFEKALKNNGNLLRLHSVWGHKIPSISRKDYLHILKNDNINLLIKHTVNNINETDDKYSISVQENDVIFTAKKIILCCGAIENARLLFISRNNILVNKESVKNIGKFYADHPTHVSGSFSLKKSIGNSTFFINSYKYGFKRKSVAQSFYNSFSGHIDLNPEIKGGKSFLLNLLLNIFRFIKTRNLEYLRKENVIEGSLDISEIIFLNPTASIPFWLRYLLSMYRKIMPVKVRKIIISHHLNCGKFTPGEVSFVGPHFETLLDWQIPIEAIENAKSLEREMIECFDRAQLIDMRSYIKSSFEDFSDASHPCCTTRMSKAPASGVVDLNFKLWGSKGIFVLGSSVFPEPQSANPTLTILTQAKILAEKIDLL